MSALTPMRLLALGCLFWGVEALAASDRDGDGIDDARDHCGAQPETRNGWLDEDGCPDAIPGGRCADAVHCLRLGSAEYDQADFGAALGHLTRGCELGSGLACAKVGQLHERGGGGVTRNVQRAEALYRQSCQAGVPEGCQRLSGLGRPAPPASPLPTRSLPDAGSAVRPPTAPAGARPKSEFGAFAGQLEQLNTVMNGGTPEELCVRRKDMAACEHAAARAREGVVVPKNPKRAVEFGELACRAGRAYACEIAGVLLAAGDGVAKDTARARTLLGKACEAQRPRDHACLAAAELALLGPTSDARLAARYLERGCNSNPGKACLKAEELFLRGGPGLAPDPQKAAACRARYFDAQDPY